LIPDFAAEQNDCPGAGMMRRGQHPAHVDRLSPNGLSRHAPYCDALNRHAPNRDAPNRDTLSVRSLSPRYLGER
jgi:hypothetical protein